MTQRRLHRKKPREPKRKKKRAPQTPRRPPSASRRSPKIEAGNRNGRRIATARQQRAAAIVINRARRKLEFRALLIDAVGDVAVGFEEAHVELLVEQQVALDREGDDEGVIVLAVDDVGKEDVLGAVGIVTALGARPRGQGHVSACIEAGGGGAVGLAGGEVEAGGGGRRREGEGAGG